MGSFLDVDLSCDSTAVGHLNKNAFKTNLDLSSYTLYFSDETSVISGVTEKKH